MKRVRVRFGFQFFVNVIDVTRFFPQIAVKARGIEAAAQNVIGQLQRIVVRIKAIHGNFFGQCDLVLNARGIRNLAGSGLVRGNGRQIQFWLRLFRLP